MPCSCPPVPRGMRGCPTSHRRSSSPSSSSVAPTSGPHCRCGRRSFCCCARRQSVRRERGCVDVSDMAAAKGAVSTTVVVRSRAPSCRSRPTEYRRQGCRSCTAHQKESTAHGERGELRDLRAASGGRTCTSGSTHLVHGHVGRRCDLGQQKCGCRRNARMASHAAELARRTQNPSDELQPKRSDLQFLISTTKGVGAHRPSWRSSQLPLRSGPLQAPSHSSVRGAAVAG